MRPDDLETTGDGVGPDTGALRIGPTEALQFQRSGFRLRADQFGVSVAVGLAEGVAPDDQRRGLDIVHRHPAEGLADVDGRCQRIRIAVGTFGIDVDQPHLHRGQRVLQIPLAGVALVVQPLELGTPVDVLLGLPAVLTTEGEAGRAESHVLQGDVSGVDHQVGPGQVLAVLLLDRPEQATSLVQAGIVGPAVQRSEPLHSGTGTAAAVLDAIGACGMPGHPDEERAVVPEVRRPPVLRGVHHLDDVGAHRIDVERLHRGGVVEVLIEWVDDVGVLLKDLQVELVGPPVTVAAAFHRSSDTTESGGAATFGLVGLGLSNRRAVFDGTILRHNISFREW